jgi:tetratricopeptide (TPR) repeat protein
MKSKRYFTLTILALAIAAFPVATLAAYPQTITTTNPYVNLPRPTDDPRWAAAFSHWDKRADTDEVVLALKLVEEIAKDKPDSYECQLWLCRINSLMAMRKRSDRDAYCTKSIEAGDHALELRPGDDAVRFWRFSSLILLRDLSDEEYKEVQETFSKYREVRPLPAPVDDPLWKDALSDFDARLDRDRALLAIKKFKVIDAKYPDRIEAKLHIAFAYGWLGAIETEKDPKAEQCFKGVEWARKAVEIEPRNPAASYILATTLGSYVENTGMIAIIRHSLELARSLMLVTEEEPSFLYGGFSRYFASAISVAGEVSFRVIEILGFPREMIIRLTEFAAIMEPNCMDNHYQLGRMYISLDRMDDAKKALETAINADPTVLKYYEPENRMIQRDSKVLYDKHFK